MKFLHRLEEHGIGKIIFDDIKKVLDDAGLILYGGTIIDVMLIAAPNSTQNAKRKRDYEMHQTQKDTHRYFGMKVHVGVAAGTGCVHTGTTTVANVQD